MGGFDFHSMQSHILSVGKVIFHLPHLFFLTTDSMLPSCLFFFIFFPVNISSFFAFSSTSVGFLHDLFEGVLLLRVKYVFTYYDKLKDLPKRANVIFILRALSIKLLSILFSLSAALVRCSGDINHKAQHLCGHCGSLQTAAWDTNRLSSC